MIFTFTQDNYRLWARVIAGLSPSFDAAIAAEFARLESQSIVNEQY